MAFLTQEQIRKIGFKSVGKDVQISDKAVIYRPENIVVGNHVRIDDFCVLANNIILHDYIHLALKSNLLSSPGAVIEMENYTGLGYQSLIFTASDDFTHSAFINPTLPDEYRHVTEQSVHVRKFGSIGAGSIVMPGADIEEGTTVGAMTLVMKPTKPWMCYFGSPARGVFARDENVKNLEKQFLEKYGTDG